MSTKAELQLLRALHRKKVREEEGLFLVQGPKLVGELLTSGWPVHALYATADAAATMRRSDAIVLPPHELERASTLENGTTVLAVVPIPPVRSFAPLHAEELVLALDGIADPGNLGTVLRIADWFGISRILCDQHSVEVFNPKCVQASMGAVFRVAVHYSDLVTTLSEARNMGTGVYMATMEGRSVFEAELKRPSILVLGSESHGISDPVRAVPAETIAVPRVGAAESLNVAMAAAALCMEFTRQRAAR